MDSSTERYPQDDLNPLSGMISQFLEATNRGTIIVELDRQLLLRLKIDQGDLNKINLEFGQKFIEILLETFTEMISDRINNPSNMKQ